MKKKSRTIAVMGVAVSLALLLSYVEVLIPPLFPSIPGIKMGLANIIIMFLLYRRNAASAAAVSILRILLVTVLFSNVMALAYSVAGAVLSLSVMIILYRWKLLSPVGVSIAGGVFHNVGQILAAMLLLDTAELGYYLVVLTATGIVSGILVGLCAALLIRKIPEKLTL